MTREDAEKACKRLAAEDPDRETHRFVPHQAEDGSWNVAKIALAPSDDENLTAETRADGRPPQADDPRSNTSRNTPYGG